MASLQTVMMHRSPPRLANITCPAAVRWIALPIACLVTLLLLPVLSLIVAVLGSDLQHSP